MDTCIKTLTHRNLRALIEETERTLIELKSELERREGAAEESAQERGIANLEQHMRNTESSLKSIREFLAYLTEEWKKPAN